MKLRFTPWQFFLLQGIVGVTLKELNHSLMSTWAGGYVTGFFLGIGIIILVNHYMEFKELKEAKKK